MKNKFSEIWKWAVFYMLFGTGFLAFLVLAGENDEMPIGTFCLYKLGAIVVILLCVWAGKKLEKAGLLPQKLYEEMEDEEL
jgi:hypothetical protein